MFQSQFKSRFSAICEKLASSRGSYDFRTDEDIWRDIGTNPRDIAFTELSELYMEAEDAQRKQIFEDMANDSALFDIWCFIRRMGKQIHSKDDTKWLELGITAALIDGARGDFRDLIASLVLLRFAAELHGIDTRPFFDHAMQNADEEIVGILKIARDHEDSDVHFIIQSFGEPEWVAESVKKYGEHPTVIEMKKIQEDKMRNLQGGKKQITTWLRSLIIFAIVFGLIVLWNYISSLIGR